MAITDLTNTKWYFNATPAPADLVTSLDFTAAGNAYTELTVETDNESILYNEESVYHGGGTSEWANESYRTIEITGGSGVTSSAFITWLTANATQVTGVPNKVIYDGRTLIDLTGDDVTPAAVLTGNRFHGADGIEWTGVCTYDADTSDATVEVDEILYGKTAYKDGTMLTGAMMNNGSITGSITEVAQEYPISNGYHDGGGKVSIASEEQAKIVSGNIKSGVNILGVDGSMASVIDISTDEEMTAVLTEENVGQCYRFTGTTGTYTNGDLYVVERSS